jgi:glycerate kinase
VSGFQLVADEIGLDELVEGADLVITGEGFLDDESFDGKVLGGVAELAHELGVPCLALVGEVVEPLPELPVGLTVISLSEMFGAERSMADPCSCAARAVQSFLSERR